MVPNAVSNVALTSASAALDAAALTSLDKPVLAGKADPGVTVNVYNGASLVGTGTAHASTGVFSITLTTAVTGDGVKALSLQAVASGVTSALSTFTYTLDTTAPAVPTVVGMTLASDTGVVGDGITSATMPTITGKGVAGSTIKLTVDSVVQAGTATVDASGNWSYAVASDLVNGAHSITAVAADRVGNVSASSAPYTFTIQTGPLPAAPILALQAGSDTGTKGDHITSDTTPTFDISGIDASASAVEISLDGGTNWTTVSGFKPVTRRLAIRLRHWPRQQRV